MFHIPAHYTTAALRQLEMPGISSGHMRLDAFIPGQRVCVCVCTCVYVRGIMSSFFFFCWMGLLLDVSSARLGYCQVLNLLLTHTTLLTLNDPPLPFCIHDCVYLQ